MALQNPELRERRIRDVGQDHDGDRVDATTRAWLGWLVGARLMLAGLSLGLAVILDRMEAGHSTPAIWGVYWTVAAAFTATIVSALMAQRTQNPHRFAIVQVGIDVAIVTSLVYFSGADESVFTFLYAIVVLYGALVLDRNGVALSAGLAAAGYGLVLFGSELGVLPAHEIGAREHSLMVLGAYWGFYVGALLILGMLANTLSAELRRTGAALDRRTHDLRRLRDLHLRTVESIGSGLLTTDESGRVTSFNPEAERISGVKACDAEGQLLEALIPGASALVEDGHASHLDGEVAGRNRIAFLNPHGDELYLGLAASNLRDEEGGALGKVVIFQDVTKVVSMEYDLRQSERLAAVGEMAARIAHEIRNPLAAISGSVQILQCSATSAKSSPAEDTEQGRLMNIVVREVDRLNGLIGDFLLYSRPAPLRREDVCLASLVEEVAKMSEGHPNDSLEIDLELDSSLYVPADRSQLTAVIWNLWNNALESMPEPGRLSARVSRVPRDETQDGISLGRNAEGAGPAKPSIGRLDVMLEIEDTGIGIPPDVREMIFEPFFTTKPDGTGLGLATVQRIIEQHGGSIQIQTEKEIGTCFRICLEEVRVRQ